MPHDRSDMTPLDELDRGRPPAGAVYQFTFAGSPKDYDAAVRRELRCAIAENTGLDAGDVHPNSAARPNLLDSARFDVHVTLAGNEERQDGASQREVAARLNSLEGETIAARTLHEVIARPDFPAASTDYDPAAAWWLANLAALAYRDQGEIARHLEYDGFHKVTFFDVNGTQGFLAEHAGMGRQGPFAALAFRGTDNDLRDIITDIRMAKRRIRRDGYSAHGGFLSALDEVWSSPQRPTWEGQSIEIGWYEFNGVEQALAAVNIDGPLFMTGHSLGGALATLAAHRRKPAALYTFGSPRVAGRDLARHLNHELGNTAWRVVNSTDVVPRVPPPLGFGHVGQLVYLTFEGHVAHYGTVWRSLGRYFFEMYLRAAMLLTALLPKSWIKYRNPGLFGNHRISEYIRKLEANLPAAEAKTTQAGVDDSEDRGDVISLRSALDRELQEPADERKAA